jgi:pSer/pThr/pTyr-binding forkhead associated (FHA) protein
LDKLNSFIAQPAVLVIAPATLLLLAVIAWYVVSRNGRRQPLPETGEEIPAGIEFDEPGQQPFQSGTAPSRAVLMLPNGMEITVAGPECAIGRADLARAFGLDDLGLISRKHFRITRDGSDYYIADSESDNGTCVNGEEIGTESPRLLSSGDTITLAGSVTLKVRIL